MLNNDFSALPVPFTLITIPAAAAFLSPFKHSPGARGNLLLSFLLSITKMVEAISTVERLGRVVTR